MTESESQHVHIEQSGQGSMEIGAVAVGRNARAISYQVHDLSGDEARAARELLDRLLKEIDQHAGALGDPEPARHAARSLGMELAQPQPNRTIARGMVDRLTAVVAAVAPLAATAGEVAQALRPWLR